MTKRKIYLALAVLALIATPAFAAGLWPTLPLVGGVAVCSSTSTGTNGQVCTTTTPAGPTAITGNETVPGDTNLTSGQSPQSVRIPMAALNALPTTYITVGGVNPAAVVTTSITGCVVYVSSGAITAATITLPPSPIDNQHFCLSSNNTITTLTVNGAAGQTLATSASPTALTVSTTGNSFGYAWLYRASNKNWYRSQ